MFDIYCETHGEPGGAGNGLELRFGGRRLGHRIPEARARARSSPERWNLEYAERVAQVARSYVDSGAQVILTNTFGGSSFILARHDLADRSHSNHGHYRRVRRGQIYHCEFVATFL